MEVSNAANPMAEEFLRASWSATVTAKEVCMIVCLMLVPVTTISSSSPGAPIAAADVAAGAVTGAAVVGAHAQFRVDALAVRNVAISRPARSSGFVPVFFILGPPTHLLL